MTIKVEKVTRVTIPLEYELPLDGDNVLRYEGTDAEVKREIESLLQQLREALAAL